MSTLVDLRSPLPADRELSSLVEEHQVVETPSTYIPNPWQQFGSEQIRKLVRHVFLPGWPKACRQVVFSPVEENTDVTHLCLRVGETLASQTSGSICILEANIHPGKFRAATTNTTGQSSPILRAQAKRVSSNLWIVPQEVLVADAGCEFPAQMLRARLAELRLEFDYCIIQGTAAATFGTASLLGHLCDGVVLVLQANATRRASAQNVKKQLQAAHARLIGTVLTERAFPIPQFLYGRL